MKKYLSTIELHKESMKFAAGHTTIFSETEREALHGHLYQVYVSLTTWVSHNGMTFDYRYYKQKVQKLCRYLNQTFLMPEFSPYIQITEDEDYYYFLFNNKKMVFLKEDVTILPVSNITVEELSKWFVNKLIEDKEELSINKIEHLVVKVYSAPGQCASHEWNRK